MRVYSASVFVCFFSIALLFPSLVRAQWGSNPYGFPHALTIHGRAIHSAAESFIPVAPESLRVYAAIRGRGAGEKEALANLTARCQATKQRLEKLGADADTIFFTDPTVENVHNQLRDKLKDKAARLARPLGDRAPKGLEIPRWVIVKAAFCADWPLRESTVDSAIVEGGTFRARIEAADIVGEEEARQTLSPEERELEEEMRQLLSAWGSPRSQSRILSGEPQFVFVGRPTDDQRKAAIQDSFTKAKADASTVASAIGEPLGAPHAVTVRFGNQAFDDQDWQRATSRGRIEYLQDFVDAVRRDQDSQRRTQETTDQDPANLGLRVFVTASFAMGAK